MPTNQQIILTAKKFNLKVKKVFLIKSGVYRLLSRGRTPYCLKRMRYSPQRLRWMDHTLQKLRANGFSSIAWRNTHSPTGRTLYVRSGKRQSFFILTPWIQGREPVTNAPEDLHTCAKTLARFHLAGQKIAFPAAGAPTMLGRWPRMLSSKARILRMYTERAIGSKNSSALTQLLESHTDWLHNRIHSALDILNKSNYTAFCQEAAKKGALCHGDSGPKNFVLSSRGCYLIDFETLRIDLRIYDLFRLIRLSCKSAGWDFRTARLILDGYQTVSELASIEYDLLKVWLQFPYKACKLLASYGTAGPKHKRLLEYKLRKTLAQEQAISIFLHELDNYRNKG